MGSLTLSCTYSQNQSIMSPEEVLETYLFGINLSGRDGKYISPDTLKFHIQSAVEDLENSLSIKMMPQIIKEDKDFWLDDWRAWNFVRMTYPVKEGNRLQGWINDVMQISYPVEWLSVRKTSDGRLYHRNIHLVPTNGQATTNSVIFSGITPHLGFFGNKQIPNYWKATYTTGFDKMPKDLLNFIGKMSAVNIMYVLDSLLMPVGVGNTSLSIDGLSQSIGSTRTGQNSVLGGRIKEYLGSLQEQWPKLKGIYKSFEMTSM